MPDPRTPEQRAADDALSAAIERCVRAYGRIEPSSMVTEWVVLGGGMSVDDEGRDVDVTFLLLPDDGATMPWRHLLGLVRAHRLVIEDDYRISRGTDA